MQIQPTEAWKTFWKVRFWAYLIYFPLFLAIISQAIFFAALWVISLGNISHFDKLGREVDWHMRAMGWRAKR